MTGDWTSESHWRWPRSGCNQLTASESAKHRKDSSYHLLLSSADQTGSPTTFQKNSCTYTHTHWLLWPFLRSYLGHLTAPKDARKPPKVARGAPEKHHHMHDATRINCHRNKYTMYMRLMAISKWSPFKFFHSFQKKSFQDNYSRFLRPGCPSWRPTDSYTALKATQSALTAFRENNQRPHPSLIDQQTPDSTCLLAHMTSVRRKGTPIVSQGQQRQVLITGLT